MSGDTSSEHPSFIGEFGGVRSRPPSFVHAISVVNRWLAVIGHDQCLGSHNDSEGIEALSRFASSNAVISGYEGQCDIVRDLGHGPRSYQPV